MSDIICKNVYKTIILNGHGNNGQSHKLFVILIYYHKLFMISELPFLRVIIFYSYIAFYGNILKIIKNDHF